LEFFSFDSEYVERLRNGDRSTEHHFVAYFEQLLRIKLRARTLASDKVEDLRQETFIRVIAALRREGNHTLWVENSVVPASWRLASEHVLTGVPDNDWPLQLNPGVCLDFVPVGETVELRVQRGAKLTHALGSSEAAAWCQVTARSIAPQCRPSFGNDLSEHVHGLMAELFGIRSTNRQLRSATLLSDQSTLRVAQDRARKLRRSCPEAGWRPRPAR
jgi:hypothetical protein